MRILSFFFLALSLVDGVFGVDVTVMEGDAVTLKPETVIPEDDTVEWWFGGEFIAEMNKADGHFSTSEGDKVGFNGSLKLDHQTGSLTITNTRTNHAGLYTLKIMGSTDTLDQIFSVTVRDNVKSLSVMEGDTVTLHTGVTDIQSDELIQWKFGDQDLNGPDDTRWRNIHRNNETGDLTIRNIRTDQSGDYKLEMNTASMILHRKLHINISDEMKKVSVKEGEPVILLTGVTEIQGYDLLWMFGEDIISNIKTKHKYVSKDKRFNGRLQLIGTSGDLIISDSKTTDSGDYQLNMISSSHTVKRNISVTVSVSDKQTPDPGLSPGAVAGIVVVLLVFAVAAVAAVVIYLRWKISKLKRPTDDAKNNGTNDPLKDEIAISDDL